MIARQRIPGDTVLTWEDSEMKRKIVYISGTRADYGLMRSVLFKIRSSPEFDLVVVVTGMHLMAEFGNSVDEIINDGFTITRIDIFPEKDTRDATPIFIGKFLAMLSRELQKHEPDPHPAPGRPGRDACRSDCRHLSRHTVLDISTGEKYPPLSMNRLCMLITWSFQYPYGRDTKKCGTNYTHGRRSTPCLYGGGARSCRDHWKNIYP